MNRTIRKIVLLLICALLLAALTACHRHRPGPEATCTEPQTCTVCGEVLAEATGHTPGDEATCTEPQTCAVCGAVLAKATGHTPGEVATCTEPQTCTVCGEVIAEATGHTPGDEATCTEPQTCTVCGEVLSNALGHDVGDDGVCRRCGKQVKAPSGQYTPGTSGQHDTADVVPETTAQGHYHNNINAYYGNSVLICGDYALEYFNLGTSGSSNYAAIVNAFAAKYPGLNVTSVIVPKNCAFQSPAGYTDPGPSAKAYIANTYGMMDSRIKKADAFGVMSRHAGEYMYYRTDHHWTGLGAYYAYVAYCNANGLTAAPLSSYSTSISTGYIGTLYNYAGEPAVLKTNPDYTEAHLPRTGYRMSYLRDGSWHQGKAVYTGNKGYIGTYMCGDQPLTVIETDNRNGKAVAVFKESYGNAFVPYLIDQYQYVIVLDIRESEGSFSGVMADYHVTDVVIINNLQAVASLQSALQRRLMS
jgi:ribosomal protein S27E